MNRLYTYTLVIAILLVVTGSVSAQNNHMLSVTVQAADDLTLVGDYYPAVGDSAAPAVLLMHMYNSSRSAWNDFIPKLTEAGYAVLNVDLRGHGETGGGKDWTLAVGDVQTWLDWLREQATVRANAVSIIGASIGSNLALVGCGNDADCVTAVALSPGLDYFGVQPLESLVEGLKKRSVLLIASQNDRESANSVKAFVQAGMGEMGVQLYGGGLHGTEILNAPRYRNRMAMLIITWLNDHTPPE